MQACSIAHAKLTCYAETYKPHALSFFLNMQASLLVSWVMNTKAYRGKAKEAFERGLNAGLEHAQYCDVSEAEYQKAYYDDTLGEIVDNYRQYSPFEFTASEFNRARNSETLWEAYDNGEYQGWIEGLEERFGKVDATGNFPNEVNA